MWVLCIGAWFATLFGSTPYLESFVGVQSSITLEVKNENPNTGDQYQCDKKV